MQPLAATCSHLQPLAATCQWLQVAASGCKWLQVAASGCKWLQVAASGCKWLQVAASGCKWLQVAASGCLGKWLQVATCPSSCFPSNSQNWKKQWLCIFHFFSRFECASCQVLRNDGILRDDLWRIRPKKNVIATPPKKRSKRSIRLNEWQFSCLFC